MTHIIQLLMVYISCQWSTTRQCDACRPR